MNTNDLQAFFAVFAGVCSLTNVIAACRSLKKCSYLFEVAPSIFDIVFVTGIYP